MIPLAPSGQESQLRWLAALRGPARKKRCITDITLARLKRPGDGILFLAGTIPAFGYFSAPMVFPQPAPPVVTVDASPGRDMGAEPGSAAAASHPAARG